MSVPFERGSREVVLEIDVDLVERLIADQHPDLADLPVRWLAQGWDNAIFRVGDELLARLPRRSMGAPLILHERRWLPMLLDGVPGFDDGALDASGHVRDGVPGRGYPWDWALVPWHQGDVTATALVDDLDDAALRLGRFLAALHRPSPPEAPRNPYRGTPLSQRSAFLRTHLDRIDRLGRSLGDGVTRSSIERRWVDFLGVHPGDGVPRWLHGDLHPQNLLVRDGALAAVIDFGDLCAGDRASDLSIAWTLFETREQRDLFRREAGAHAPIDADTWLRAQGWAVALCVAYIQGEYTTPPMEEFARRGLAAALED